MRRAFAAFLALFGGVVIGQDRFFAGLFLCFGVALLWCARDVQHKRVYVNVLAAAIFVGGIGRLLAVILVGVPHPFYIAMLALELVLPPLMVLAAARVAEHR